MKAGRIIFLFLLLIPSLTFPEIIILKSGKKISTSWIKEENNKVLYKTAAGIITIDKSQVEKIIKDDNPVQTTERKGQQTNNDPKKSGNEYSVRYESDFPASVQINSRFICRTISEYCSEWPESYRDWIQFIDRDFRYNLIVPAIYTEQQMDILLEIEITLTKDGKIKDITGGQEKDAVQKPVLYLTIVDTIQKIVFDLPICSEGLKDEIVVLGIFEYRINY